MGGRRPSPPKAHAVIGYNEKAARALRVAAAGREYDEVVRVNGRWPIQLRDVAPKDER